MFTKEELDKYIELDEKKEQTCNHIASIFKEFDDDYDTPTNWTYYDHVFEGSGCTISEKWLLATDEELHNYVKSVFENREKEAEKIILKQIKEKEKDIYKVLVNESLKTVKNELLRIAGVSSEEDLRKAFDLPRN